jgi:predicted dehydrogenase
MRKINVGIIGCGAISGVYAQNCYRLENLHLAALADLDPARAQSRLDDIKNRLHTDWKAPAAPPLPVVQSVEELLANPDVEIVLNLTVPKAHAPVALQALAAGKHTYHEKPFALSRDEGRRILAAARANGRDLRVGCAPDTFLGAAIQTCRKLLDDGWIGTPIGCSAFFTCPGHESWHPDPEFYYQHGGGPLFDMGPYYLTALVNLIGPIARVAGSARATFPTRTITSAKKRGTLIPVETPTHIASTLEFANGAIGSLLTSFDVSGANLPRIEIYGTRGTLSVPDPNTFGAGGDIRIKVGRADWATVPCSHVYRDDYRGLGVSDLASALQHRRAHRASAELGFHVLDVMQGCLEAAAAGKSVDIESTVDRPVPLPLGLREGEMD